MLTEIRQFFKKEFLPFQKNYCRLLAQLIVKIRTAKLFVAKQLVIFFVLHFSDAEFSPAFDGFPLL